MKSNGAPFHDREEIARRRRRAGKSQKTLAAEAGMSAAHLCNIEGGSANPSPEALARLAGALGCEIADLEFTPEPETADV
ncbi:MAG TPA: helix-turn-helix transcriptional regulator [Streptosporangiaceae bacterium]|jgi:transcriptional regulator with XRE-family HTH domain|nr:helix-turn-helix transcriptional regulator [Streptosporangiaceae bacterium]